MSDDHEKKQEGISDLVRREHEEAREGKKEAIEKQDETIQKISEREKPLPVFSPGKRGSLPKRIVWGIIGLILFFCTSLGYFIYTTAKQQALQSASNDLNKFRSGIENLKNFDTNSAAKDFSSTGNELNDLSGLVDKLKPLFKDAYSLIGGFKDISSSAGELALEAGFLKENGLRLFLNGGGAELISHLKKTSDILKRLNAAASSLPTQAFFLGQASTSAVAGAYLPFMLQLNQDQHFLDKFIGWFNTPSSTRHIAIFFQNPSEIRPAGGFLGSYADLTISNGGLAGIAMHDINDADRGLDLKIIPPAPLQAAVTRLRAADANWFFDFKTSAEEVLRLLTASKLYNSSSTTFDGAIAVSPKVIGDFLALTGPVKLVKENITLDDKNFLTEIQKQVQLGQATHATYPKKILEELFTELSSRIESFSSDDKDKLLRIALALLDKKDVMFYAADVDLEGFLEKWSVAGRLYVPADDFEGDYLALVDANVSGGKSDIYIKQDVSFQSQINASGSVSNHLVIDREHDGKNGKYSWYSLPNEDYLQIFLPHPSELLNFNGGAEKKIFPAVNYTKNNYENDPLIASINSSTEKIFNYPAVLRHGESGKDVWATWTKIKSGEKAEITFDYSHRLFLPIEDGTKYRFVFEKQAGTSRHYKFEISAPVGFKFKENNLPIYDYESDDPPGRLVIDLTLVNG
jgi:hypothetical protein